MNFEDLMDMDLNAVTDPSCYVCDTRIGVVSQEVCTGEEDYVNEDGEDDTRLAYVTLGICHGCSNAANKVIELEDMYAQTADDFYTVNVDLAAALKRISQLEEENEAARLVATMFLDANIALVNENAAIVEAAENVLEESRRTNEAFLTVVEDLNVEIKNLSDENDDLFDRVQAGAGLDDVAFVVIASAAYEE